MGDALKEVEAILPRLSLSERAQLLKKLTEDIAARTPGGPIDDSGIDVDPRVCGGEARIVRTRIPVWVLEQARRLGKTDADLLEAYPSLRPDDLANAWVYVARHPDEIEQQIQENEAA